MDKDNSLISIITPMYNAELYLSNTIGSVLAQSYQNYEWIIVDDGSKDNSFNIVSKNNDKRIILLKSDENKGAANARNIGLDHAKGDYVMFLDADDILDNTFLEKQLAFIKEHGPLVTASYRRITDNSNTTFIVPKETTYKTILKGNPLSCLTTMYDFHLFKDERFDIDEAKHEDFLFWIRILKKGYIAYGNQDCLASYILHKQSKNSSKRKLVGPMYHLYRNKLGFGVFKSLYYLVCIILYSKKKYRGVKY